MDENIIIDEFEKEGIYTEPDTNKNYNYNGSNWTKLMKWCILSKKYPELIDDIKGMNDEIDKQTSRGFTALILASIYNKEIVKTLVELGANINLCSDSGCSALSVSCYHGAKENVKILIGAGANPNLRGPDNVTPLMWASFCDYEKIVKILILAGADINIISSRNFSAINCTNNDSIKQILLQGKTTVKSAVI